MRIESSDTELQAQFSRELRQHELGFRYLDVFAKYRNNLQEFIGFLPDSTSGRIELVDSTDKPRKKLFHYYLNPADRWGEARPNPLSRFLYMEDIEPESPRFRHISLLFTDSHFHIRHNSLAYSYHLTHLYPDGRVTVSHDTARNLSLDEDVKIEHGCYGPYIDVLGDDITLYDTTGKGLLKPESEFELTLDDYIERIKHWRRDIDNLDQRVHFIATNSQNDDADPEF